MSFLVLFLFRFSFFSLWELNLDTSLSHSLLLIVFIDYILFTMSLSWSTVFIAAVLSSIDLLGLLVLVHCIGSAIIFVNYFFWFGFESWVHFCAGSGKIDADKCFATRQLMPRLFKVRFRWFCKLGD